MGRQAAVPGDSPGVTLKYKPQGRQLAEFDRRKEFVRVLIGPLGSGKTFAAIMRILRAAHTQTPDRHHVRRSRWCIARNSLPDLLSTTIPDVRQVVDDMDIGTWNMSSPITWTAQYARQDGTKVALTILFRSFDGEQATKKARGMQLTGIWVDELAEFHKANFDMLVGRVKRYPPKSHVPDAKFECLATSNSCAKDHWLAKIALAATKPHNWWVGIQPGGVIEEGNRWVENPRAENFNNLPRHYYRDQLGGKKESWIRQNLANQFVNHGDGRPVHPGFNEQLHVGVVHATPGIPLHVGIDFGRTPAAVVAQRQLNGQWYVLRELVTVNMGAKGFGKLLLDLLNSQFATFDVAEVTGDPSGEAMAQTRDETPFDMLALAGIEAMPAYTNDPLIRYEALDEQLTVLIDGAPGFIVDESCTTLIRGLAGEYNFRRLQVVGSETYQDKPNKGPTSHVCEALHYMLLGAGEGDALFDEGWENEYGDVESWAPADEYFE